MLRRARALLAMLALIAGGLAVTAPTAFADTTDHGGGNADLQRRCTFSNPSLVAGGTYNTLTIAGVCGVGSREGPVSCEQCGGRLWRRTWRGVRGPEPGTLTT